jgi:hypothetical protein
MLLGDEEDTNYTPDPEIEALISLANNKDIPNRKPQSAQDKAIKDIRSFIRAKNIVPGNVAIPITIMYDTYCRFSKDPITRLSFTRYIKTFFPIKRSGSVKFCKLTTAPFDLPSDYTMWSGWGKATDKLVQPVKKQIKRKSKFKGVFPVPPDKWVARFNYGNVVTPIGIFSTEEEAAKAYDTVARNVLGAKAELNFPNEVQNG